MADEANLKDSTVSQLLLRSARIGGPDVRISAGGDSSDYSFGAGVTAEDVGFNADARRTMGRDPRTTGRLSGYLGPLDAYYSKSEGENTRDQSFGGSLGGDRLRLFAERNSNTVSDAVDPRYAQDFINTDFEGLTDTVGLSGQTPLAGGTLSGGANRQFFYNKYPQHMYQESRPKYSFPPVSQYDAQYQRPVGRGIASLGANLRKPRGGPTDLGANVGYSREDPFGLGGFLTASGYYRNPRDQKSSAGANLGYQLRF